MFVNVLNVLLNPWGLSGGWWCFFFFASRITLNVMDRWVATAVVNDDDDDKFALNQQTSFHLVNAFQEHIFVQWVMYESTQLWKDPCGGVLKTATSVATMFLLMDVVYMVLHRAMHTRQLYTLVHKFHHVSKAPNRGYADAAYTHPLEHFLGLLATYAGILATHYVTKNASGLAVGIFVSLHGLLSITNHLSGSLGAFHRAHHRHLAGNYAQHLPVLDWIAGTLLSDAI